MVVLVHGPGYDSMGFDSLANSIRQIFEASFVP